MFINNLKGVSVNKIFGVGVQRSQPLVVRRKKENDELEINHIIMCFILRFGYYLLSLHPSLHVQSENNDDGDGSDLELRQGKILKKKKMIQNFLKAGYNRTSNSVSCEAKQIST